MSRGRLTGENSSGIRHRRARRQDLVRHLEPAASWASAGRYYVGRHDVPSVG